VKNGGNLEVRSVLMTVLTVADEASGNNAIGLAGEDLVATQHAAIKLGGLTLTEATVVPIVAPTCLQSRQRRTQAAGLLDGLTIAAASPKRNERLPPCQQHRVGVRG
jgi:hypothetical protein